MEPNELETILHPHRFAVVAALSKGNASVDQLKVQLPHIPQASMYRAIQKLEKANLITRVNERQTRGTIEVTYGIGFSLSQMTMPDQANLEHYTKAAYSIFFHYVLNMLEQFKHNEVDQLKKAKFNAVPIMLSDEQYDMFLGEVRDLLAAYMHKGQSAGGTAYQLTTFMIPERKNANDL